MTSASRRAVSTRRTATGLLILGMAGGLLSGCGTEVEVAPPPSPQGCALAVEQWPATVADQATVDTSPRSPSVAAWGDPPIIARCGVEPLGPTTSQCLAVDGVDWVVEPLSDGVRFTTFGRDPALEVLVPSDYRPEPLLLPAFGAAAKALPTNGRTCS